jgi:hypothetical protein
VRPHVDRPPLMAIRWPLHRRALAVGLLAIVLVLGLSTSAVAAPSETFSAGFSPWSYLGEGTTVSTELTVSGSEYEGEPAPLTSLTLHLPAGTKLSSTGFPTCSSQAVRSGFWWEDCPEGSLAGPVGSLDAVVAFGGEMVFEQAEVQAIFGPSGTLYFVVEGHYPISLEFVMEGHIVNSAPDAGPELELQIPLIETVPPPLGQLGSITDLHLELGASREEADGVEVNSISEPAQCLSPARYSWSAEAGFNGEAATPIGTNETDCPPMGARAKSSTTLGISPAAPYELQPVTYTATVQRVSGGSLTSGSVTFYDHLQPIEGCSAEQLVPDGAVATASCTTSYFDPLSHEIHAAYLGGPNYRGSSSTTTTFTVQEGTAPPTDEHHEVPKDTAHEEPKSGDDSPTPSTGSSTLTSSNPTPLAISSVPASISSAQVAAALKQQLVPSGQAAKIGALLKNGGLAMPFTALEAGTLSVQWYELPVGAKLSKTTKAKPVLVAVGELVFSGAGTGQLKVKLTSAGRRVLREAKRVGLTVTGKFAAGNGIVITALETLRLRQ